MVSALTLLGAVRAQAAVLRCEVIDAGRPAVKPADYLRVSVRADGSAVDGIEYVEQVGSPSGAYTEVARVLDGPTTLGGYPIDGCRSTLSGYDSQNDRFFVLHECFISPTAPKPLPVAASLPEPSEFVLLEAFLSASAPGSVTISVALDAYPEPLVTRILVHACR
jgi:hypothetical protein